MATHACVSYNAEDKCCRGKGPLSASLPFLSVVPTTWQEWESNIPTRKWFSQKVPNSVKGTQFFCVLQSTKHMNISNRGTKMQT